MLTRQLTQTEELYRRLMFAYNHYNGDSTESMKRNKELLLEVRASETLAEDFKTAFEYMWYDQVSKLRDTHENWRRWQTHQLEELGFK